MLRARLFGELQVELNGTAIESPATQRPWTLFAYLALAPGPVSRAELANTFWPDVLDQSARASLRSALWALRRQLGEALVVEGERVGLGEDGGLWVDAREFEQLAERDPGRALKLCRGELLEGIGDDWAMSVRERHRERVILLLEEQAQECEQRGDTSGAIELTRRQIERDKFDEQAHQRLIARLASAGDRAGAVRAYRALAERVRRELGVVPSARTRELVDQLRVDSVAPSPNRVSAPPGLLPLIGRDRELLTLERAWRVCASGAGAAVIVRGEAGIGKTRLATELRLRVSAAGAKTATCAALDLGGTAPLSLWAELIRELLPTLPAPPADAVWPDDIAVLVAELPAHFARGGPPSVAVAPDLQRTRLFEAVVALLEWATREAPLLLVLEDAHIADGPSLELAGYLARRASTLPVMMLMTSRELPRSADADRVVNALRSRGLLAGELELEALRSETVAALAREAAWLSNSDVTRVIERAEGNALLAVETARSLGRGEEQVAPSLRGSVRAMLAPLPSEARRLLELVSVAARPLEPRELAQLPLDGAEEAATQALETGLLLASGARLGFRHALLRDAVYEEIAPPRRRGLHHRWAQALLDAEGAGGISRPDEVARQLRLADADADAVPQLVRAATAARGVAALEQAAGYLEEALSIAPDRPDDWLELGEIEAWRGRRERAEAAFKQALALLEGDAPAVLARAWLRRARAYHGLICVPRAVLESAAEAMALLEQMEEPMEKERSEALAALAWAEAVAGSVEKAERLLRRLSLDRNSGGDLQIYDVGHARALALMRRGRFVDSYGPSIAAGEAVGRAGRPDLSYGCWANAASAASAAGEHDRALEFLQRGLAALTGQGLQSLEIHLLGARSFVLRRLGRVEEARAAAESERALAEQLARPELIAMASHDRGLVALEAGQHELATTLLEQSLVQDAPISRPLTRLALAEALSRSGEPEGAEEQIRETVLEPLRPSDFPEALVPRLARVQGLIAVARDQLEEAERRLEEAVAGWERLLARTVRAESITGVLADLGRPVVGLVEPERELALARGDLEAIRRRSNALVQ